MTDTRSRRRLDAFRARCGEPIKSLSSEVEGIVVHLHVFRVEREGLSPIDVVYTDGLSDMPPTGETSRGCELVWYVPEATREVIDWLWLITTVCIVDELDPYWRIIPMAVPPTNLPRLSAGSELTSVAFVGAPLGRDDEEILLDGRAVDTLWVLPITEAERTYLNAHPGREFGKLVAKLLNENKHPYVLDPIRRSYV